MSDEIDVECFEKIKEFSCELIDHKTNHIRIIFTFSGETAYFSNLTLQLDSRNCPEKSEPIR